MSLSLHRCVLVLVNGPSASEILILRVILAGEPGSSSLQNGSEFPVLKQRGFLNNDGYGQERQNRERGQAKLLCDAFYPFSHWVSVGLGPPPPFFPIGYR